MTDRHHHNSSRRGTPRRWLRRSLQFTVGVAAAVGLFGVSGGSAAAANSLVSSNPANGSTIASSPSQVTMTFLDALGPNNAASMVCGDPGVAAQLGAVTVAPDQKSVTIAVLSPLPVGTCNLSWSVTATDGSNGGTGSLSFNVQTSSVAAPAATTTTVAGAAPNVTPETPAAETVDDNTRSRGPEGLARLIAIFGVAVLFGSLVVIALAWPEGVEYILTVRFLRWVWVIALVGCFLHVITLSAYVTGKGVGSSIMPTGWTDLAKSAPGAMTILRLLLVCGCGWVVARPERVIDPVTQAAALALPGLAVATLGISRSNVSGAVVGYAVGVVHALAMAVWVGGLILLTRVVLSGPGDEDLVHAVRGFARLSGAAIAVTVVTGAINLFRLDRGTALFSSGHGRVALLKTLLVAAMVFVGVAARQLIKTKLSRANALGPNMAVRLRKSLGVEAMTGVVAMLLSAWLAALVPTGSALAAKSDVRDAIVFPSSDGNLEVRVAFTQVVGANAVRVEVVKPSTGVSNLVVLFAPPPGSVEGVGVLTIPQSTAPTAFIIPLTNGITLNTPGSWTVTVQVGGIDVASKVVDVTGSGESSTPSSTTSSTIASVTVPNTGSTTTTPLVTTVP